MVAYRPMKSTATIDQWKHLNALCKKDIALANRINTDAYVLGILISLDYMLRQAKDGNLESAPVFRRAVPMPKSLYFGRPDPFSAETVHYSLDLPPWVGSVKSLIYDLLVPSGWERELVGQLDSLELAADEAALSFDARVYALSSAWRGLCALLRDRCWTIARAYRAIPRTIRLATES